MIPTTRSPFTRKVSARARALAAAAVMILAGSAPASAAASAVSHHHASHAAKLHIVADPYSRVVSR